MDYSEQLLQPEWYDKRIEILDLHGHSCQECGEVTGLQIHHISYDLTKMAWEYDNDNFMCLCEHHHKLKHIPTCCKTSIYAIIYDVDARSNYLLKQKANYCYSCGKRIL